MQLSHIGLKNYASVWSLVILFSTNLVEILFLIIYLLLTSAILPIAIVYSLFRKRLRTTLSERLGFGNWLKLHQRKTNRIIIHAASLGEVNGIAFFAKTLKEKFRDREILITTTSDTGKAKAASLGFTSSILPFDHPFLICWALFLAKPMLIILSETEIWPGLLLVAHLKKIPLVLINGRISNYSFPKYKLFSSFISHALKSIDLLFVQTNLDQERFLSLGAQATKVTVSGSTKYETIDRTSGNKYFPLSSNKPCFVAGSVRPKEDEIVIRSFAKVKKCLESIEMIIAPRHPNNFENVATLLKQYGLNFSRMSASQNLSYNTAEVTSDVLLLDTIGDLEQAYSFGNFAFVGGTFVDIGGHNILEPAKFGLPVIVGTYTSNVHDSVDLLKKHNALLEVNNEETLTEAILKLASNLEQTKALGQNAKLAWRETQGATSLIVEKLLSSKLVNERNFSNPTKPFCHLLRTLSLLYAFGAKVKNTAYDREIFKSHAVHIPVISVGNIVAGGSGKSPFTSMLASHFLSIKKKPAILTRGYKGRFSHTHIVTPEDSPEDVGDEPLMHAKHFASQVQVIKSVDRVSGARLIEQKNLSDIIILDDGLQHRRLKRNLDILLVDISSKELIDIWHNGKLLPLGTLRESKADALKRASCICFLSRTGNELPNKTRMELISGVPKQTPSFFFKIEQKHLIDIYSQEKKGLLELKDKNIGLISGIERPEFFKKAIEDLGGRVIISHSFFDHHKFTKENWDEFINLSQITNAEKCKRKCDLLVTTAKDAVKLNKFLTSPNELFSLEISCTPLAEDAEDFFHFIENKFS